MSLVVLALMACVFSVTTGELVIAGILPDIAGDLSVSIPSAGLLVTAYAIGMVIGGPVLTALTRRFARKPFIAVLMAVVIAGNVASTVATTYRVLLVARVVSSFVVATFFANAVAIAASSATPGRKASTVAKLALGMNLATILGAPIGTVLGHNFGWRSTFLAIAACCVVGLVLILRLVPAGPRPTNDSAVSELRVFGQRDVQLAILMTAVGNAGLLMVFTYFAPLLTDVSGFAAASVAGLLLVYGVGATVGNLAGGWLSDRALMPSLIGMLSLLTASLVLLWRLSASAVAAAIMVFVVGAVGFSVIPGMQTRVMTTAHSASTLAIAVNASAFQLAAAFAAWLGGQVLDNGFDLRSLYLVAAAVTVVGIGVTAAAWLRDNRRSGASLQPAAGSTPGP